ncbi:MAG TPA: hypothetical protein VJ453_13805 [Terriglobales bacterium]|nr:hypothetical protein [Terriglobales bacterium]
MAILKIGLRPGKPPSSTSNPIAPGVAVEDAVRVELEVIDWRDGLNDK